VTIVLNDAGKEAAADAVSDRVNRGDQVLALNLLIMFTGSSWKDTDTSEFVQMLDGIGDRPIGMEAAQLISISRWARERAGVAHVRLDAVGIRSQGMALVAASQEPDLFSEIKLRHGTHSLSYLLALPVTFEQAPDLFCLDLYKNFDIDSLEALAAPAKVTVSSYVEVPQK
jgi:hypothetical protein